MAIRRKLDTNMNILVSAPVMMALRRLADENMVSMSDIVRAAINLAVPMQYERFPLYLEEARETYKNMREEARQRVLERTEQST